MPNVRCGIDNTLDRHDESTLRLCGKSSIHLDTTLSLRVETILPYVKLGKTVACKLHYLKYHTRTHDCLIDSDGNLNMSFLGNPGSWEGHSIDYARCFLRKDRVVMQSVLLLPFLSMSISTLWTSGQKKRGQGLYIFPHLARVIYCIRTDG